MNKRLRILLNYIIGPLLFIWLSWSIYKQIQRQPDVQQSWQLILDALVGSNAWKIIVVFLLMFVNWGIEARKWQLQVKTLEQLSFLNAFKSIFAGQAMGLNTINRIGEPATRAMFLKDGNRIRGALLSVVGSMAQIIATFLLGVLCLLYLRIAILDDTHQIKGLSFFWMDTIIYVIGMGIILFTLAYFRLSGLIELVERIRFVAKYKFFVEKLETFKLNDLTRILTLSFGRYFVFLLQYYLLFQVFGINLFWADAFSLVGVLMLVLAIVPTIALAELGLRGQVSLLLFGLVSSNTMGIIATAAGIWLINIILPAIFGTLFILSVRIFKGKGVQA